MPLIKLNRINKGGDLVLNGEELALQEVGVGGTALSPSRYTLGDDTLTMKHSTARRKGVTIRLSRRMKHVYPRAIRLAEWPRRWNAWTCSNRSMRSSWRCRTAKARRTSKNIPVLPPKSSTWQPISVCAIMLCTKSITLKITPRPNG